MSDSYTTTETASFTETHARHMAAKVATDLKRMQRFYGSPIDTTISAYEAELTALLKAGFLGSVIYGYQREGRWIEPTLRYTARELCGATANDDDPGRVLPGRSVEGASFCSYLLYHSNWDRLTFEEKRAFSSRLPFQRNTAPEPGVSGYFAQDLAYSAGGRCIDRSTVRSF